MHQATDEQLTPAERFGIAVLVGFLGVAMLGTMLLGALGFTKWWLIHAPADPDLHAACIQRHEAIRRAEVAAIRAWRPGSPSPMGDRQAARAALQAIVVPAELADRYIEWVASGGRVDPEAARQLRRLYDHPCPGDRPLLARLADPVMRRLTGVGPPPTPTRSDLRPFRAGATRSAAGRRRLTRPRR